MTFYVGDTRLSLTTGSFAFGPEGRAAHVLRRGVRGGRSSVSRRCSSRGSCEKSASPPPSVCCRRPWRVTPTWRVSRRSRSETVSRSSGPRDPLPATNPPPARVRPPPPSRVGVRPTLQSGRTRARRHNHRHRQVRSSQPPPETEPDREPPSRWRGAWSNRHPLSQTRTRDVADAPCYHMVEIRERPDDADVWRRAAEGETLDLTRTIDGYAATVDWPAAAFWRQLSQRIPTPSSCSRPARVRRSGGKAQTARSSRSAAG